MQEIKYQLITRKTEQQAVMKKIQGYTTSIVILHWLIAIGIFILIGMGWYMVELEKGIPEVTFYYNLHKSIGLVALVLVVLLINFRVRNHPPELPDSLPTWEIRAAKISHLMFYIFLVIVPLSGYFESNFTKWGIDFFGFHMNSWGPENKMLYTVFNRVHVYGANLFVVLIAVHFLAALKHMIKHNGVVYRILPESIRPEAPQ